jgi:Lon protease-like protein
MFPLGSVLFPTMVLPLHVFEPRYRALTVDCLRDDRTFGVVLIERGSEVGGGDVRTDVGTTARIIDAEEMPDGRWTVIAVGTERIRVHEWLDDDPYPRARVEEWPEPPDGRPPERAAFDTLVSEARRIMALASEANVTTGPATAEITDDPVVGTWQLAAMSPLGALDRQGLLCVPGTAERIGLLSSQLADAHSSLVARINDLDGGPPTTPPDLR